MISLYVNLVKIGEMSEYTPVSGFRDHPLLGKPRTTFTLDDWNMHFDFNMVELFRALRQDGAWAELGLEFDKNPLKVYTKLVHGLPNPWLHVPYGTQAWLNSHLVLGYVKAVALLDISEIVNKCRRSAKFDHAATNTLTIYQGDPLMYSVETYDITDNCSIRSDHAMYRSGSLDITRFAL